jgi:hypothetical protein
MHASISPSFDLDSARKPDLEIKRKAEVARALYAIEDFREVGERRFVCHPLPDMRSNRRDKLAAPRLILTSGSGLDFATGKTELKPWH